MPLMLIVLSQMKSDVNVVDIILNFNTPLKPNLMNRTIKFRAWENYGSKWVYSSDDFENMSDFWEEIECGNLDIKTLGQSTNLTDKNGKEIYEGDVVKWSDGNWKGEGNPRIAEVRFDPELCFFAFNVDKENGGRKFGFSNFLYTDTEEHLEVIGNIFQDEHLLSK